jgi:hypothetical protein
VRINKESSGGRGEYEWCDFQPTDPAPDNLQGRRIFIRLPDGHVLDTGSIFGAQGGKQRIRLATDQARGRDLYPHWHAAAALMLPRPSRDETSYEGGLPIMRNGEYGIGSLQLGSVDVAQDGQAVVEILRVGIENQSNHEEIDFRQRYEQVRRVCAHADRFDDEIRQLLERHAALMASGGLVSHDGLILTADLQHQLAATAADYDVVPNQPHTDALPTLESILQITPPEAPLNPQLVPEEDIVLRRRTIAKQRRWASARGGAAVRFRRKVQQAYRSTCIVCGIRLPSIGPGSSPGVDAAHILPYAEYDLDDVRNGLCLCKLHHWAFDEALIHIRWNGERYEVVVPETALQRLREAGADIDIAVLRGGDGTIVDARLPLNAAERPSPQILNALEGILYS